MPDRSLRPRRSSVALAAMALVALSPLSTPGASAQEAVDGASPAPSVSMPDAPQAPSKLAVLWTSGDPEVATRVAFMYTLNARARGWWDHVTLIVWGPSSKLLSENEELQAEVAAMQEAGVEVVACQACADSYGVSDALRALGIEVKYMGVPLTEMLKDDDWEVITF